MGRLRALHLGALAACLLAAAWPCLGAEPTVEEELIKWSLSEGAEVNGFAFARSCPSCPLSVVASMDLQPEDIIMKIPVEAVLQFKDLNHDAPAAQLARVLLDNMHNDPGFNETWGVYWATLPGPDGVLSPEVFSDELLAMLQTPELELLARHQRQVTEQVYLGTHPSVEYAPFTEVVPDSKVGLDTFKWVASLVSSRWWWSDVLPGGQLVPLMDRLSHSDAPNALTSEEDEYVILKAIEPISKGEAITINYQHGVVHRPDMSLFLYGFVNMLDEPLLCSVDLPTFDVENPFQPTSLDDHMYEDADSGYVTWDEYDRLSKRLAALDTTVEQDQQLLDSGMVTGWRQQAILQYRVLRKRALELALWKIAAGLEEPHHDIEAEAAALEDEEDGEVQQDVSGFPATFWVLAVAGGVNSFAAVVLAVVVNRLAVAVQASAEAAACASETAVSLVELSTAQALASISARGDPMHPGKGGKAPKQI